MFKDILIRIAESYLKRHHLHVVSDSELQKYKIADARLNVATKYLIRVDNGYAPEVERNRGSLESFVRTLRNSGYGEPG